MSLKRVVYGVGGYPFAAVVVLAAALLLLPLRPVLAPPVIMLAFVPVITTLARLFGVRASAAASVFAFFLLDFLYLPPYYRLVVGSLPEWIGLFVFLVVALVAGQQTGELRRRERAAVSRQAELELLNRLSFRIASATSPADVAAFVVGQATDVLGATRAALYAPAAGPTSAARCLASAGEGTPSSGEEAIVDWVMRRGMPVGLPGGEKPEGVPHSVSAADAVPGLADEGIYLPLSTADSSEGVLHAVLPADATDVVDPSLLVAVANLVAASFERQRLEEEASHTEALLEADRLKTTLVSSVSHELKTPLAAATARVTGLLDEEAADSTRVRAELAEVADDLERLNASIGDLLDVSRLESDAWRPQRELYEVGDILATVLSRLPARERGRVTFSLSGSAPFVCVDFAQLVRALVNVVENALAYSSAGSPVTVSSAVKGPDILVVVEDRGPGVPEADKERIFEKFYRGQGSGATPAGTGLGLTIAREIARSHGGRLWVEDAVPGGARFVMSLPAGGWAERR